MFEENLTLNEQIGKGTKKLELEKEKEKLLYIDKKVRLKHEPIKLQSRTL
jgi:hypothetical protein